MVTPTFARSLFGMALASATAAVLTPGCGGAIAGDDLFAKDADAGANMSARPDASPPSDAATGPTACAVGAACTGGGTCRPCKDECDGRCAPLACANGRWVPIPSPLPPRCVSLDAGTSAPPVCTLPPVDVSICVSDQDCTKIEKGCYCGPQLIFAVNNAYASVVETCERAQAAACALQCDVIMGYRADSPSTVTQDPDAIVAVCDQTGESGRCTTRLRR